MLDALQQQSITLSRQSPASGATRTFVTLATGVPCYIKTASRSTVTAYAMRRMVVDATILTTTDLNALIAGGVLAGDRANDGTTTYIVQAVRQARNPVLMPDPVYELDCEIRQT